MTSLPRQYFAWILKMQTDRSGQTEKELLADLEALSILRDQRRTAFAGQVDTSDHEEITVRDLRGMSEARAELDEIQSLMPRLRSERDFSLRDLQERLPRTEAMMDFLRIERRVANQKEILRILRDSPDGLTPRVLVGFCHSDDAEEFPLRDEFIVKVSCVVLQSRRQWPHPSERMLRKQFIRSNLTEAMKIATAVRDELESELIEARNALCYDIQNHRHCREVVIAHFERRSEELTVAAQRHSELVAKCRRDATFRSGLDFVWIETQVDEITSELNRREEMKNQESKLAGITSRIEARCEELLG